MSIHMITAKENLENIIKYLEINTEITDEESLSARLKKVNVLVTQNQSEIWLRTKKGKPLAEALENATKNTLDVLGRGASDALLMAVEEIEAKSLKITEESRRRSMVVT